jgi:c-di-GMP-binding flagellar brake protein YcgR
MAKETYKNLLNEGQKVDMFLNPDEEPYTVIIENVGDDHVEISAPLAKGYYVPLELGKNVRLLIGNRNGLFTLPFRISGREAGLFNSLKLEPIGQGDKIQRRNLVRMEMFIEFDLESPYGDSPKLPQGFKILRGKRGNMSGGGLLFWANRPLIPGQKINVRLNLEPHYSRPVVVQARVVRVLPAKNQTDIFAIALEFVSIREGDRDKIVSYVMHKERSILRKESYV